MLNRRLTGALLLAACFAFLLSLQGLGCSSSNGTTSDGGTDGPTSDTTFTQDAPADVAKESSATDGGNSCGDGGALCSGKCVNTMTDPMNCGGCGGTCGSGLVCASGQCSLSCGDASGLTECSGGCYDLTDDNNNCGSCGHSCGSGQVCSNSMCGQSCGGSTLCSGACTDTMTDNANCGSCGHACSAGTVCGGGTCSVTCLNGFTQCTGGSSDAGSFCADTQTDFHNCGSCGHECQAEQVCNAGACSSNCSSGFVNCGGNCVDPTSDNDYCGASGGCGVGDAGGSAGQQCPTGTSCVSSSCQVACVAPLVNCGGTCIDPRTSDTNCGATAGCGLGGTGTAGSQCTGGQVCANSACSTTCGSLLLCGNPGVCVDPNTSTTYCGATGNCSGANKGTTCQPGQVCAAGVCQLTCSPGLIDCGGTCIDPTSNINFCGATGNCQGLNAGMSCQAGYVCTSSTCELTCQNGFVDCTNQCIDPTVNLKNCGATTGCGVDGTGQGSAGMQCASGEVCSGNPPTCQTSCLANEALCPGTGVGGGSCINPNTDNGFCGAETQSTTGTANTLCNSTTPGDPQYAGVDCTLVSGRTCNGSGVCVCPVQVGGQNVICDAVQYDDATAYCVDPGSDPIFCGATPGCGSFGTGLAGGATPTGSSGAAGAGGTPAHPGNPEGCTTLAGTGSTCGGGGTPNTCGCPNSGVGCTVGVTLECINPSSNNSFCGALSSNMCAAASSPNAGDGYTACSDIVGSACSGTPGTCQCSTGDVQCPVPNGGGGTTPTCIDPTSNDQFCGASAGCAAGTSLNEGGGLYTDCTTALVGSHCIDRLCQCPTGQVNCMVNGTPTCIDPTTNNQFCGATTGCAEATAFNGMGYPNGYVNCDWSHGDQGTGFGNVVGSSCVTATTGPNANIPLCSCPTTAQGVQEFVCAESKLGGGTQNACVDPSTNNEFCGAISGTAASPCAAAAPGFGQTLYSDNGYTDCTSAIQGSTCSPTGTTTTSPTTPAYGECTCPKSSAGVQEVLCGTQCVDPSTNSDFCGATAGCPSTGPGAYVNCASQYAAGSACTPTGSAPYGACTCPAGDVVCDLTYGVSSTATCIDPATSATNCGAQGTCTDQPDTYTYSDPNFYGYDCSTDPNYGAAYVCNNSTCQLTCQTGLTKCGVLCTDTSKDAKNCNGCGDACNSGICSSSSCQPITYTLDSSSFQNLEFDCGDTTTAYGFDLPYGFEWRDNGAATSVPTSIQIDFVAFAQCSDPAPVMTVQLNGVTVSGLTYNPPAYSSTSCTCGQAPMVPTSFTIPAAAITGNYNIGGSNTIEFAGGSGSGVSVISGTTFATVTVTFSPE